MGSTLARTKKCLKGRRGEPSQLDLQTQDNKMTANEKVVQDAILVTLETLESARQEEETEQEPTEDKPEVKEEKQELVFASKPENLSPIVNTELDQLGLGLTVSTTCSQPSRPDYLPQEKKRMLFKQKAFSFEEDEENGIPIKRLADLHHYRLKEICCTLSGPPGSIETIVPFLENTVEASSLHLRRHKKKLPTSPL